MSVFSKYFDKVYCINLYRRPDRWDKVSKIFEVNGIDDVVRFSAVDGNQLNLEGIEHTNKFNEFDQYMNSVPNDWDMVFIGGNHLYGNPPVSVNEKIIKLNHTVAIHCIAIKHTIYDAVIEVTKRRMKHIDGYYADLQKGYNSYSFTPNMALQYEDFSDIQNRNVNYDNFLKN